jgi:hypothetical protein
MADIDMITLGIRQSTINDNYDPLADVNEQQSTADSHEPLVGLQIRIQKVSPNQRHLWGDSCLACFFAFSPHQFAVTPCNRAL